MMVAQKEEAISWAESRISVIGERYELTRGLCSYVIGRGCRDSVAGMCHWTDRPLW
jgi:hypothetical protein